jgi:hypothetical protein
MTSRGTTSGDVVCGGRSLATVLSLNACAYGAKSVPYRDPLVGAIYGKLL